MVRPLTLKGVLVHRKLDVSSLDIVNNQLGPHVGWGGWSPVHQSISIPISQNKTTVRVLSVSIMAIHRFFCDHPPSQFYSFRGTEIVRRMGQDIVCLVSLGERVRTRSLHDI